MNQSTSTNSSTAIDPVCGMTVDPTTTKYASEYQGQTYYFCSLMCLKAFEDQPQQYLSART
jgi:Cu+-exporting ATPase